MTFPGNKIANSDFYLVILNDCYFLFYDNKQSFKGVRFKT